MKTALIYYSKTGFTKRYAQWLSERVSCELVPVEQAEKKKLKNCELIIFASWFHAGKIQKLDWFKSQDFGALHKIVLATGATPYGEAVIEEAIQSNFKADRADYKVFYLPSGLCYEKMGLGDRCMMKVFEKLMRQKKDKTRQEEAMAKSLGSSFDHSKKEYLDPVVEYVHNL